MNETIDVSTSKIRFPLHRALWYTEKLYCSSDEKIEIGLMSDKNTRQFSCDLYFYRGKTPLGKNTADIYAQNHTITSKGRLLRRVRMGRLSPIYFYAFRLYKQSSSDNRVAFEMGHAATFPSPRLVTRARTSICNHTFHLRSTIVAATKPVLSRLE
jgi:hypothetical protein